MKIITLEELVALQNGTSEIDVIDVRLDEDFNAGRLPSVKNASVLKVSFLEDLAALGCAKDRPIIVYGDSSDSHESRLAAGKLGRAGFADVREFRGGLRDWQTSGQPVDGNDANPAADLPTGIFQINLGESRVEWLGRNLLNKHRGTIGLKTGRVQLKDGTLVGGEFVINMNAITCSDIPDSKINQVLINHLKSDDFFDVDSFPEARFKMLKVEALPGATPGVPNVRISGELNLRGKLHPLVLTAVTGLYANSRFGAQAAFVFDRTLWNSIYGSGKFFENVGMHLVNDLIEVQVCLVA